MDEAKGEGVSEQEPRPVPTLEDDLAQLSAHIVDLQVLGKQKGWLGSADSAMARAYDKATHTVSPRLSPMQAAKLQQLHVEANPLARAGGDDDGDAMVAATPRDRHGRGGNMMMPSSPISCTSPASRKSRPLVSVSWLRGSAASPGGATTSLGSPRRGHRGSSNNNKVSPAPAPSAASAVSLTPISPAGVTHNWKRRDPHYCNNSSTTTSSASPSGPAAAAAAKPGFEMVLVATNDVEVEIDTANKDTEVEGGPPSSKATAGKKTVQMGRVGAIALPALASLIILAYFHGVFWVVFRWAWPDEYDPKLTAPRREQIRVLAVAYLLFVTIVLATFVGFKRPEDLVAAWSGTRGCSLAGKKRAARLAGPGFLGAIAVNFMMMACIMAFLDTRRATGGQVEFPFKRGNCSRALSGASNADVPMPDFAATGSVCQAYTKGDPFIKSRAPINKCLALHGVPEKERMVTLHQMLSLLTAMLPVWERGYGEGEETSSSRWANFGLFKAKCAAQYELAACSAVFPTCAARMCEVEPSPWCSKPSTGGSTAQQSALHELAECLELSPDEFRFDAGRFAMGLSCRDGIDLCRDEVVLRCLPEHVVGGNCTWDVPDETVTTVLRLYKDMQRYADPTSICVLREIFTAFYDGPRWDDSPDHHMCGPDSDWFKFTMETASRGVPFESRGLDPWKTSGPPNQTADAGFRRACFGGTTTPAICQRVRQSQQEDRRCPSASASVATVSESEVRGDVQLRMSATPLDFTHCGTEPTFSCPTTTDDDWVNGLCIGVAVEMLLFSLLLLAASSGGPTPRPQVQKVGRTSVVFLVSAVAATLAFASGVKVLRADGTRHATGWSFAYFVVSGALVYQPLRVVFPFRLIGAGGRGFEENDQEDLEGVQRSESRQRPRRMATRKKSSALQRKASESWRSFKRQHPCVQRLVRLWAWAQQDVFDPGGRLYVIKMALLESATTTLQIVGIVNEAPTTNGIDIVVWSWLITFNISALSLVGMLFQFPKRFEPNYVMAILIGTNVLSDQSYMFYTLFLKEANLSSSSSFGEELIFHAQTLVPAAMVALVATDIIHLRVRASEINEAAAVYKIQNLFKELLLSRKLRDAAATSSQRQTTAATIIQIRYRNRKAWRYVAPITNSKQHCVKRRLSRRSIIRMRLLVAAVGLLFGTYTTISYQIRANGCYKVLGRAAVCATPQYYFANGWLSSASSDEQQCHGLESVVALRCAGSSIGRLPETAASANMSRLSTIDLAHNPLRELPETWSQIPSLETIDLTSTRITQLPFWLCDAARPPSKHLREVVVKAGAARTQVDWSSQGISRWDEDIALACRELLELNARTVNLANNSVGEDQFYVFRRMPNMRSLDLSHNRIANLPCGSSAGERRVQLPLAFEEQHGDPATSCPLVLAGNPITEIDFAKCDSSMQHLASGRAWSMCLAELFRDLGPRLTSVKLDAWSALTSVPSNWFTFSSGVKQIQFKGLSRLRYFSPSAFAGATALEDLELYSMSELLGLPSNIFEGLGALTKLTMWAFSTKGGNNGLETLPSVSSLTNLRHFDVRQIWDLSTPLPSTYFRGLDKLTYLRLLNAKFSEFRESVFVGLSGLTYLTISLPCHAALPPNLLQGLANLNHLRIDPVSLYCGNSQAAGQDYFDKRFFAGLHSLTSLGFATGWMSSFPDGMPDVSQLTKLRKLDLRLGRRRPPHLNGTARRLGLSPAADDDIFVDLPENMLANCSELTKFSLTPKNGSLHRRIRSIPPGFFRATSKLKVLDLYNNALTNLDPATYSHLSALTYLRVLGNRLSTVPATLLERLTSLNRLYVHQLRCSA